MRLVKILYFLEDDSISVVEPPVENSGFPQRVFIKRQRLVKNHEDGMGQSYYTARDFNVAQNITFYDRTFRIVSCDSFTKVYVRESEPSI